MADLDFTQAIGPQLRAILHRQIVRNALEPGAILSESEVARKFSVSRQPVRETFIKLAEERLVDIRPQRGTVVSKIDPVAVLDARFVREAVEADIVRLLAKRTNTPLLRHLEGLLDDQDGLSAAQSEEFHKSDEDFHLALAEGAGMLGVWQSIQGLKTQMDRVRFLAIELHAPQRLVAEHREIVGRIANCDVDGAEQAIRKHLRSVLVDLPEIMKRHPEAFSASSEGFAAAIHHTDRGDPR